MCGTFSFSIRIRVSKAYKKISPMEGMQEQENAWKGLVIRIETVIIGYGDCKLEMKGD